MNAISRGNSLEVNLKADKLKTINEMKWEKKKVFQLIFDRRCSMHLSEWKLNWICQVCSFLIDFFFVFKRINFHHQIIYFLDFYIIENRLCFSFSEAWKNFSIEKLTMGKILFVVQSCWSINGKLFLFCFLL